MRVFLGIRVFFVERGFIDVGKERSRGRGIIVRAVNQLDRDVNLSRLKNKRNGRMFNRDGGPRPQRREHKEQTGEIMEKETHKAMRFQHLEERHTFNAVNYLASSPFCKSVLFKNASGARWRLPQHVGKPGPREMGPRPTVYASGLSP